MDHASERTLTDLDEYVALRIAGDGSIAVEISPAGFSRPPAELARLIVDTAAELPHPAADGRDAIESGIDALSELHQAMATGGFDALTAMMRRRLGIEEPPVNPLAHNPDTDATLASALGATLDNMRQSVTRPDTGPPTEVLEATAFTEEGDVGVSTSSERIIAGVQLGAASRQRGVEDLGRAITEQLARARADLAARSGEQLREDLPDEVVETVDTAPEEGEKAADTSARMIDEVVRVSESLRRKAGM